MQALNISQLKASKEQNKQQKTWFVQEPALILPEYLVEFEYSSEAPEEKKEITVNLEMREQKNKEVSKIFEATILSSKILQNTYLNPQVKDGVKISSFHIAADSLERSDMGWMRSQLIHYLKSWHILELIENNYKFTNEEAASGKTAIENSLPPEIPQRTKYNEITQTLIKSLSRESNVEFIKYLNLFNNNFKTICELNGLTNLTTLILSFNEIKTINGLESCINLKKLDLNHNFISKIEGINHLKELTVLNLSNNWISEVEDIKLITKNDIPVSELSLKWNPIAEIPSYRAVMFKTIPYLK